MEFYVAEQLGKTLDELRAMPNDEFVRWCVYFGRKAQRMELQWPA